MEKRLYDFFKRSVLVALATFLWTFATAQVTLVTVKEPGSYGTPTTPTINVNTGDACSDYTGSTGNSRNFSLVNTGLKGGSITYSWSTLGGISISGSATGATVAVAPFIDSKGRYNKGRLKVFYKGVIDTIVTGSCSGTPTPQTIEIPKSGVAYVDIYQKFDYSNQIVGPVCVSAGDSVAYSIKDLVSGNIDDGIGIDSYFWNIHDVTSIIDLGVPAYISGDNSAYTFLFSDDPIGGEQIKVTVGRCNHPDSATKQKVKTLAPKLPSAEVSGAENCIATSATQVSLTNIVKTGITYKWVLANPNFTFASGSTENSQSGITVNIGKQGGLVYIVSSANPLTGNYCDEETVVDTIRIKRKLDGTVVISGETCVTPGSHTYTLVPNPNTRLNWKLPPVGWSIDPDNEHASTVPITVASNALSGTLKVVTEECPTDTISLPVNVAPVAPGPITGDTCVARSTSESYSISAVPNATSYTWTYPSGFTPTTDVDETSITFDIESNAVSGDIRVVANGCAGATSASSLAVNFAPTNPGTISRNPAGCINRGIADTITFTAANCIAGQTYEWIVPAGWTKVSPTNLCSLTVYTNGTSGTHKVKARGVNNCGTSAYDSLDVSVTGVGTVTISASPIEEEEVQIGEFLIATNVTGADYQWYQDGVPIEGETTRFLELLGSTSAQVCVRVTKDGCMTQTCRNTNYGNNARIAGRSSSKLTSSVKLFPNPTNEQLNIAVLSKFTQGEYIIFNMKGNEVHKGTLSGQHASVNTSSLEAGNYVVAITLDGETCYKKITVSK